MTGLFKIYCLVQTFPCDSQPCLNGAICANDVKDITKYHCKCTSDYSGVNCQGKPGNAYVFVLVKVVFAVKNELLEATIVTYIHTYFICNSPKGLFSYKRNKKDKKYVN